jgi:hypothetical protein
LVDLDGIEARLRIRWSHCNLAQAKRNAPKPESDGEKE